MEKAYDLQSPNIYDADDVPPNETGPDPSARLVGDLPIEDYHDLGNIRKHGANAVLSKSMLGAMDCPAKFKWKYIDGGQEEEKSYLNIGSAVHTLALEPDLFSKVFFVLPDTYPDGKKVIRNPAHKAYQELLAQAGGKTILSTAEHRTVMGMAQALAGNKKALALLRRPGKVEASIFWTDDETGIKMRCRPDFMADDGLIIDLKTAASADKDLFCRSAWSLHYDMSVAITCAGYKALTGKMPENYIFIAVEKEAPHIVEVYDSFRPCDPTDPARMNYFDAGWHRYREALKKYRQCMETGIFPSYSDIINPMSIPFYGLKQLEGGAE